MGTSSTPAKKPPAKKSKSSAKSAATAGVSASGLATSASKPAKKTRSRSSRPKMPKAAASSTATAPAAVTAASHIRIPTNLPMLIVDNGGWTVKYGLLRPPPTSPVAAQAVGSSAAVEGALPKSENDNATSIKVEPHNLNDGETNNNIVAATTNNNENNNNNNLEQHNNNVKMSSMYNATAQPPAQLTILTGDEITSRMKNLGQLSWNHPLERGMICDGATQLRVWARILEVLGVIPLPVVAVGAAVASGGGGLGLQHLMAQGRRGKQQPMGAMSIPAVGGGGGNTQQISSASCAFILLEPPFVPSVISDGVDKILFRELGMGRVARLLGPCMAAVKYVSFGKPFSEQVEPNVVESNNQEIGMILATSPEDIKSSTLTLEQINAKENEAARNTNGKNVTNKNEEEWVNDGTKCCCVVDSGYSFTHVVPTHRGGSIDNAIRRLNIGGKVLTNLLKEAVTYRQWNMMDEYHIVNDCKEQLCFISAQFEAEMNKARNTKRGFRWFDREFLLPDFVNTFRGTVRLPEPLLWKKEREEEEQMKMEIEKQQKEKNRGKGLQKKQKEHNNVSEKTHVNENDSKVADSDDGGAKSKKSKSKRSKKPKQEKKKPKPNDAASDEEDGDEDMDGVDSDEESDQQRLNRLKEMREQERRRREQESQDRQALAMSVERFAIPEVLFHPSDIGLDCGGIAEAIVESIDACDSIFRAAMYNNVLLVGGNARLPGFRERVELELRKLAPVNYPVRVYLPDDPISYAWEGAKQFCMQPNFQEKFTVDRISWEAMKTAGKDQKEIWGGRIHNTL